MNWQKIYSTTRTVMLVGGSSIGAGIFYASIITGICRMAFKLEENTAIIWIGLPIFVVFTTWAIIYLPRHFRKAGLIESMGSDSIDAN